jgi:hypothetical protein
VRYPGDRGASGACRDRRDLIGEGATSILIPRESVHEAGPSLQSRPLRNSLVLRMKKLTLKVGSPRRRTDPQVVAPKPEHVVNVATVSPNSPGGRSAGPMQTVWQPASRPPESLTKLRTFILQQAKPMATGLPELLSKPGVRTVLIGDVHLPEFDSVRRKRRSKPDQKCPYKDSAPVLWKTSERTRLCPYGVFIPMGCGPGMVLRTACSPLARSNSSIAWVTARLSPQSAALKSLLYGQLRSGPGERRSWKHDGRKVRASKGRVLVNDQSE